MIQRIQSIYLFLAFVCALGLFIWPIYTVSTDEPYLFNRMSDEVFNIFDSILLLALSAAAAALSIINIFLYRNRKLQMSIGRGVVWATFIFMAATAGLLYLEFDTARETAYEAGILFESDGRFRVGVLLPFLIIIFSVLAVRNIKKDEKLVKSTERLI